MKRIHIRTDGREESSNFTAELCDQLLRVDRCLHLDILHGPSASKALPETIAAVSVLLTSANALYPQIAHALALWLSRPGSKSVTITHSDSSGMVREVRVESSGLGPEEVRDVIVQALRAPSDD